VRTGRALNLLADQVRCYPGQAVDRARSARLARILFESTFTLPVAKKIVNQFLLLLQALVKYSYLSC
jgi:hypothetical protein